MAKQPQIARAGDSKDAGHTRMLCPGSCTHRHREHRGTTGEAITLRQPVPPNLSQQQDVVPAPPAGISAGEKALKVVGWGSIAPGM